MGVARKLIRPGQANATTVESAAGTNDATATYESCQEIADDYEAVLKARFPR